MNASICLCTPAGMIRGAVGGLPARSGAPRVCGDDPPPGAEEQWAAQADRRADERFEPPETARGRRALTEHYWQAQFPGAIAPQTIPRRAATGLRRTMDACPGGVLAAARRWEAGQDDAATDALFAPFRGRDLSDREKTEIVDLLRAHPALAEQLWRSAVMIATTRRTPTTAAPASP